MLHQEMDLSALPEELVEYISKYLSFEDLCVCSRVNHNWRNAFNINGVWRRFCSYHPEYFNKQISNTKYVKKPNNEYCEAKERKFKEIYTQNNAARGNYHITEINVDTLYCDSLIDAVDKVGNHWLFVSCMEGTQFESEHKLQVWSLSHENPILHRCTESPLGKVNRLIDSQFVIDLERLFYVYGDGVLVYEFAHPCYELLVLHRIFYTSQQDPSHLRSIAVIRNNMVVGICEPLASCGTLFICVWNKEGLLTHTDIMLSSKGSPTSIERQLRDIPTKSIRVIQTKTISGKLYVFLLKHLFYSLPYCWLVCTFDIESMKFEKLMCGLGYLHSHNISGNSLSLLCSAESLPPSLTCYNITDNTEIFRYNFLPCTLNEHFVKIVPDTQQTVVVLSHDGRKNVLYVLDALGKLLKTFILPFRELSVAILNSTLLLVCGTHTNSVGQEVWNFKSGHKIYNLDFSSKIEEHTFCTYTYKFLEDCDFPPKICFYRNPDVEYSHISKNNKVFVLSFW